MRDDLLKEHLMGYARTAADEAAQPDAAAIHRRARRHYQRVAALTVAGVLLAVGLGLGLSRDHTTPTVNQPLPTVNQIPPVPPPPAPGPTPSTATAPVTGKLPAAFVGDLGGRVAVISTTTGRTVRTLYGSSPSGPSTTRWASPRTGRPSTSASGAETTPAPNRGSSGSRPPAAGRSGS